MRGLHTARLICVIGAILQESVFPLLPLLFAKGA